MKKALGVVLMGVTAAVLMVSNSYAQSEQVVGAGKKVKFDYTLTIDGKVAETSEGRQPIEYVHGSGQVIPGLEAALVGLKVGDQKKITLEPKDAYGEVLKEGFRDVPKTTFPADFKFEKGVVVEMQTPEGQTIPAVIWEIKDDAVTLNFNHPLAGKTLDFDIKIVGVEDAPAVPEAPVAATPATEAAPAATK